MQSGKAAGGEHRTGKGEGQREDGVLPLDHFQSRAEVVKNGHSFILAEGDWTRCLGSHQLLNAKDAKDLANIAQANLRRNYEVGERFLEGGFVAFAGRHFGNVDRAAGSCDAGHHASQAAKS